MLYSAQEIAYRVGQYARRELGRVKIEYKSTNEMVTAADRHCQNMIISDISRNWPGHGFIGEEGPEGKLLKQPPSGSEDIWWIIDPIDGTRNYAHGLPHFVISIAAMKDNVPVIGIIYDPNTDLMFTAQQGQPARCNDDIICCRNETLDTNSQIAVCGLSTPPTPAFLPHIIENYIYINIGTAALHWAYVAQGGVSGAIAQRVKLWDIAAGAVIAQCAGAQVTDWQGNSRFPINCHSYQGQPIPILIAGKKPHEQLVNILNSPAVL